MSNLMKNKENQATWLLFCKRNNDLGKEKALYVYLLYVWENQES